MEQRRMLQSGRSFLRIDLWRSASCMSCSTDRYEATDARLGLRILELGRDSLNKKARATLRLNVRRVKQNLTGLSRWRNHFNPSIPLRNLRLLDHPVRSSAHSAE